MAMNDVSNQEHPHPGAGRMRRTWPRLLLALAAAAMLLTSVKAIGVLLPYINSQLF